MYLTYYLNYKAQIHIILYLNCIFKYKCKYYYLKYKIYVLNMFNLTKQYLKYFKIFKFINLYLFLIILLFLLIKTQYHHYLLLNN